MIKFKIMDYLDNYHLILCKGLPAVVLHHLIKILLWVCIYSNFTCYTNRCVTNPRTYHRHSTSSDMHLGAPACKHRSLRSLLLECYYSNCSSFHSTCSILSLSLLHLRPLDGLLLTTQAHALCSG